MDKVNSDAQDICAAIQDLLKISQPVFSDLKWETKKLKMDLENLINENDQKKKELQALNSQYEQKKKELNEKSFCFKASFF
jgi:hypothetical protein